MSANKNNTAFELIEYFIIIFSGWAIPLVLARAIRVTKIVLTTISTLSFLNVFPYRFTVPEVETNLQIPYQVQFGFNSCLGKPLLTEVFLKTSLTQLVWVVAQLMGFEPMRLKGHWFSRPAR